MRDLMRLFGESVENATLMADGQRGAARNWKYQTRPRRRFDDHRHSLLWKTASIRRIDTFGLQIMPKNVIKRDIKMIGTYDMRNGFDSSDEINVDT